MSKELLGTRIAQERKKLGLSQSELAKKLNLTQTAIAKQETGTNYPSVETLESYADFFGVTTDYLLGRTDKPEIHVIDNPPEFADVGAAQLTRKGGQPFTPEQVDVIKQLVKEAQEKNK